MAVDDPHSELAGKSRLIMSGPFKGATIVIEDYWGAISKKWDSEFAFMLYGKIDGIGQCVWMSHLVPTAIKVQAEQEKKA